MFDTTSSAFCELDNLLSSLNLCQVVQEPTRVASSGNATLIDLALVSNVEELEGFSVLPPLMNSDHNGISLTVTKTSNVQRQIWKYLRQTL